MIKGRECCGWKEEMGKFESLAFFPLRGGAEHFVHKLQAETVPQYNGHSVKLSPIKNPLQTGRLLLVITKHSNGKC